MVVHTYNLTISALQRLKQEKFKCRASLDMIERWMDR